MGFRPAPYPIFDLSQEQLEELWANMIEQLRQEEKDIRYSEYLGEDMNDKEIRGKRENDFIADEAASVLKTTASESLDEEVKKELEIGDPRADKASAALDANIVGKDEESTDAE